MRYAYFAVEKSSYSRIAIILYACIEKKNKMFMKKPTHMTNDIGLRQQIKFGDVDDYKRSGVVEGQSEKYNIEYTATLYIILLYFHSR